MNKSDDRYNSLLDVTDNNDIRESGAMYNERISNYPRSNSNIAEDFEALSNMGFDESIIKKVYIFLHPETIEDAIEFMSEVNGIYQHDFYLSRSSNVNKCLICGNPKEKHISHRNRSLINAGISYAFSGDKENAGLSSKNVKRDSVEINSGIHHCSICEDDIPDNEIINIKLKCGHICCSSCWYEYLKVEIESAKVSSIHCFTAKCPVVLTEDFILNRISNDEQLKEKYELFKKKADILNSSNKKFCPEPNCDSYLEKGADKYVKCKNGHKYCYVCLKQWHGETKCDEELDKDFQVWRKGKVIKQCPNCKFYTEKNKGCNHMTCVECKFQWCWLCEQKYDPGHFERGACRGMQFVQRDFVRAGVASLCDCCICEENIPFLDDCMIRSPALFCFGRGCFLNFSYLFMLVYFFSVMIIAVACYMGITEESHFNPCVKGLMNVVCFLIASMIWICFQLQVTCLTFVYSVFTLFYPKGHPIAGVLYMMENPDL